jgi:hypothetical protein
MVGIRIVNDSAEEGIVKRNGVTPKTNPLMIREDFLNLPDRINHLK